MRLLNISMRFKNTLETNIQYTEQQCILDVILPEQTPQNSFFLHGQVEQRSIQRVAVPLERSFSQLMSHRTVQLLGFLVFLI